MLSSRLMVSFCAQWHGSDGGGTVDTMAWVMRQLQQALTVEPSAIQLDVNTFGRKKY